MVILVGTAQTSGPALSFADLGDGVPEAGTGNRRYVCPLCAPERHKAKKRDLSVDLASGAWQCWHCGQTGKLTDYWTERPRLTRTQHTRARLHQAFTAPPPADPEHDPDDAPWRQWLAAAVPLAGTLGARYLEGRSIPIEQAAACGVQYIDWWYGRPGIVYPLRDQAGKLAAVAVRYVDTDTPKTRVGGKLSLGVFATPEALRGSIIVLVEGPADALSLALCGVPAVALNRTSAPAWLVRHLAFKHVVVALDADTEGDRASAALIDAVKAYGAMPLRLRPPAGKDWNDTLMEWGAAGLRAWLADGTHPDSEVSA